MRIKLRAPTLAETLTILSMIGGAIAFLYLQRAEIKATLDWWRDDAAIIGTWTNTGEGSVNAEEFAAKTPEDVVWLSIEVENGTISGMIHTPRLCNVVPWNYVMVDGSNSLWRTIGSAFDYVGGRQAVIGGFSLERDNSYLVLTPASPTAALPKAVRLVRSSEKAEEQREGVPPHCENSILEKLVKQRRSPSSAAK
ncbi:hypothetical protein [Microvirga sp. G4-2]|uniref:hypothetical protein n=1 Tax=Microvirga sp. G4-2 TaxID=3434467 RepID=UPI004043E9AA